MNPCSHALHHHPESCVILLQLMYYWSFHSSTQESEIELLPSWKHFRQKYWNKNMKLSLPLASYKMLLELLMWLYLYCRLLTAAEYCMLLTAAETNSLLTLFFIRVLRLCKVDPLESSPVL